MEPSLLASWLDRSPIRYRTYLVYRLPMDGSPLPVNGLPSGGSVAPDLRISLADEGLIRRFFADEPAKQKVFLRYLHQGFTGALIHSASEWATYGWLSSPETSGPVHLYPQIQAQAVHWLFAFQTQPHLRGRGLYKATLRYLVGLALSKPTGGIYIDTHPTNLASRRGIVSVGFQPCGVARTYIAGIPKLRWWKWGHWQTDHPHPELSSMGFTRP